MGHVTEAAACTAGMVHGAPNPLPMLAPDHPPSTVNTAPLVVAGQASRHAGPGAAAAGSCAADKQQMPLHIDRAVIALLP
jgi:hypothetical protein